jgi:hypothetical protein
MTVTAMILWMITSTTTTGPSSTELVRTLTDQIRIQTNGSESAESLYRAYTNVINTLKAREENFKKFNASVRPDLVKKWEEVDDTPRRDPVTKKVVSVHEAKFKTSRCFFVFLLLIIVLTTLQHLLRKKRLTKLSSHARLTTNWLDWKAIVGLHNSSTMLFIWNMISKCCLNPLKIALTA